MTLKELKVQDPEKYREQIRVYNRRYYTAHKEEEKLRTKLWLQNNQDWYQEWASKNKERRAANSRKCEYGITPEEYDRKLSAQDGKCAVCHKPMARPDVDHNHETGAVRDLLCRRCNTAIGLVYESEGILLNIIAYLRRHNGKEV